MDAPQDRLELARAKLSVPQIVALYVHIRDVSLRLEEEWRGEFIEAFPGIEDALPEALYPPGSLTPCLPLHPRGKRDKNPGS
jgi:hypothetical protein